ncbi:MAG: hypothetical protein RPS47_08755, partial [Colwellia sp.]
IQNSGIASDELSNKLLSPLQLVKQELNSEVSIPQILMLQSTTADDCVDEALTQLNVAVEEEEKKRKAEAKKRELDLQAAENNDIGNGGGSTVAIPTKEIIKPAPAPLVKSKQVVDVSVSVVQSKVSKGVYIESAEDVKAFINALEKELTDAISTNKRVRIR